jgi:HlyD family secretion protein
MNLDVQDPRSGIRKLNLLGCALMVLLIGGFGGWASTSELSGAVIAPGTIVVESYGAADLRSMRVGRPSRRPWA